MKKNNIPENETRAVILAVLVKDGIDFGASYNDLPGKYISKLEDVLEEITEYYENKEEESNEQRV